MSSMIDQIAELQNYQQYRDLHWEGSFEDYLEIVRERPQVTRNAFQRLYDMVISRGFDEYIDNKKKLVSYHFFRDDQGGGRDAVFGLDIPLQRLVTVLRAAAEGYGPQNRVLLLHGPVGSSKSTIARLLKKGIEEYSRTSEGALYTYDWVALEGTGLIPEDSDEYKRGRYPSPMNEEPLKLIPEEWREAALTKLGLVNDRYKIKIEGDLNPACRFMFQKLLDRYEGHWDLVISRHIRVRRLLLSEKDRVGIGTFQPKDEKNQDSTELTGDINYRKIAVYGSDSDPRAFNFDGEFNVANRGIVEFVEVLKLDVAFLYDLLGASQEHKIKPKKFAQTDIDEVILGHTNEAEYRKLLANEFMEALRDRTIKIDVPYITRLSEEIKIYAKSFGQGRVRGKFVAPHTLEVAAMWSILTRLEDPKKHNLSLLQKMKLYDGKLIPGFTQDTVKELRKDTKREGMDGISPRFVQDMISNALVRYEEPSLNAFMVLNEIERGLKTHSLISGEEQRKRYMDLISVVRREYEEIIKNEVQRAISADESEIAKLAANYVDNVRAFTLREKVKNKFTGRDEEPDERLMRSIEERIEIPESRKDDFRREIMNFIGGLALEGKKFLWNTNDRLRRGLELKLFEDKKDTIKFTTVVSNVMDRETQEKIDAVKTRMIRDFGYDETSAQNVLEYVSSIFARGDAKN
ncbi:MAG: serine protein kinase [Deltaproteobacteria bacterium]|nr:serine protein kinase [Deltaproteobacteria bacterium]